MAVNLYTLRIVLNTLGISDYGIYGIVSAITVFFSFLKNSISGATSRFLTFELGCNNSEKLKKNFSAALTIHVLIAGIIFILTETLGLWGLENKIVIPIERMSAANWVFQLSMISSMVSVIQVPYSAMIIAHERMNVYAYIEILNYTLQLIAVYLLSAIGSFDKLILYAAMLLGVSFFITLVYKFYCVKNFSECKYKFSWEKEIIYPILKFSVWDLYGNMAVVAKLQGINILFNIFFGVAVNSAYSIATLVDSAIINFSGNFLAAVRPRLVKYYAANEIARMEHLIINSAKISFFLLFFISLPLIIENHFILHFWLKNVPDYTVSFCQLNFINSLQASIFFVLIFAIHATGKIRSFSFISGSIYLSVIPISYFLLKAGYSPIVPFIANTILFVFYFAASLIMTHLLIPQFSLSRFVFKAVFICFATMLVASVFPIYLHYCFVEGWLRFIIVVVISIVSIAVSGYFIMLNQEMRQQVRRIVFSKVSFRKLSNEYT
ncbi:MATE family efflux transporter [Legionella anisa]|uniref:Polysaccharide biosynthesis protein n=1 Tax=Legionella anisa TaxID=28082 RepID=A0AAX0WRP3_9GAMM|nr:MATE family efflux transporter [Legionella anisa]AWN75058.1 polysaccharide biosynthesis protein [Legionella anisa]KTC69236.1 hypothetical protein Lani_2729 [Legionella anisa]MBN5934395.1 MATE family efflux transporter [Legionella anisa]PNL60987.1 polysaccharide biosynthesis protein [Legionella anisa]UAK80262.1 MATE family efflux transporter [Legionella anisa]